MHAPTRPALTSALVPSSSRTWLDAWAAKTLTQLSKDLDSKVAAMRAVTGNSISVAAGCQLFLQFVTRTTVEIGYQQVRPSLSPPHVAPIRPRLSRAFRRLSRGFRRLSRASRLLTLVRRSPVHQDVARCKELLIERGEHFAQKAVVAKQRIGELGEQFIQDGSVRGHAPAPRPNRPAPPSTPPGFSFSFFRGVRTRSCWSTPSRGRYSACSCRPPTPTNGSPSTSPSPARPSPATGWPRR